MNDETPDKNVSSDEIDNLLAEFEDEADDAAAPAETQAAPSREDAEEREAAPAPEASRREPTLDDGAPALPPRSDGKASMRDMEFLKDIPLVVSVEVGRTKQTIGELLSLGSGSIVELEKLAGEPLEIFVNQKLVARGEAVIVNEKFGVRLTDVVSHSERLENLKQ
ncbi:MAG: flagellar motor switch protein FliN [Deltaproteobacteria bacterium]|nr:flagellar motor switch protein FliN [Deltaproteobacteria bacterium]MCB9488992.1 flagellar motor switch protein FliN [Deltaproteobacteria bacterium]